MSRNRRPMLLDVFNSWMKVNDLDPWTPQHAVHVFKHRARRYLFEEDGSAVVGEMVETCADLLIEQREFIIPPFETTYFQLDLASLVGPERFEAMIRWLPPDFAPEIATIDVGFLAYSQAEYARDPVAKAYYGRVQRDTNNAVILRDDIRELVVLYGFTSSTGRRCYTGSPFRMTFRPGSDLPTDMPKEPGRLIQMASLLAGRGQASMDSRHAVDLVSHVRPDYWLNVQDEPTATTIMNYVEAEVGEYLNFAAACLMLQRPNDVRVDRQPAGSHIFRGKRQSYSSYNTVTVHLRPQTQTIRRQFFPSAEARAAHEVAGHFAHWGGDESCGHNFERIRLDDPDGKMRWKCADCGMRRTFKKAHTRGDASKGFVSKDYIVKL